jgi:selenocysteine lyase/cysteine desulfurase
MDRRKFLLNSGMAVGSAMVAPHLSSCTPDSHAGVPLTYDNWADVRKQFLLNYDHIQMAQMLIASHPAPVREAIERHRRNLDVNTVPYLEEHYVSMDDEISQDAATYMGVSPDEVVLTTSTTHGLALLYSGLKLKPGDEILSTTHDHYVTDKSLDYAAEKCSATIKRIDEYADPGKATVEEITSNFAAAITQKTRIVAITWVHSCTGVKLPIREIAEVVANANTNRSEDERIYLCVDGVHGFGNQDVDINDLGCDFFCAGTHKWLFGPRGTGLVWGKKASWHMVAPIIPAFRYGPYLKWLGTPRDGGIPFSELCTPGGFHAFEHRWAMKEAFEFHMEIGRAKVHQRTTALSTRLKEGIADLGHVKLHTPVDPKLSAGINAFEIDDYTAVETANTLHERNIIASTSPYKVSYARLTPCIINTEEEVDFCIDVMKSMGS